MVFQIGAQLLDACVLALVDEADAYGYMLTTQMREKLDVSESTLYPVLRRLQRDGFLATYDQEYQGRNRRYYSITEPGRVRLNYFRREFTGYVDQLANIIGSKASSGDMTQGLVSESNQKSVTPKGTEATSKLDAEKKNVTKIKKTVSVAKGSKKEAKDER